MTSLPAGLVVHAPREALRRAFGALCALQPVRFLDDGQGLVCAPRAAPELATSALARCPFPTEALAVPPGWPDPPADLVAGWYRRSPHHAPAPPGWRELVQSAGEGFGPGGHSTTDMCLRALELCPPGPALDAGCGSGVLAQAWAALARGPVLGVDLDVRALGQAARGLQAAGLGASVTLRRQAVSALTPDDLAGRVLLANLPVVAHRALVERADPDRPPRAAVVSGVRLAEAPAVVGAYRALGLQVIARARRGRFECWTLCLR